jgi:hypothetical protein
VLGLWLVAEVVLRTVLYLCERTGMAAECSNEVCITRSLSHAISGRDEAFRVEVRERDGKCVISSRSCLSSGVRKSLPATQLPRYSRWITNRASAGDTGINSVQNGILLHSGIRQHM